MISLGNSGAGDCGYCIYVDTVFQGPIPVERDEAGMPIVYLTCIEAQREIAEDAIERLRLFLAGEREFEDAITVEEYVVPVTVHPDVSVTDEDGNVFPHDGR